MFSLDVPSSLKTLVISYVGMIAREVPVQDVLGVVLPVWSQNLERRGCRNCDWYEKSRKRRWAMQPLL